VNKEFDRLYATLTTAMKERDHRSDVMDFMGRRELEWVVYERQMMLGMVNHLREERGLDDVTIEEIESVESMATGHSDYAKKFALYCADLAVGAPQNRTI